MTGAARLRVTWQSRWGLPIGYSIHSEEMALHAPRRGGRPFVSADALAARQHHREPRARRDLRAAAVRRRAPDQLRAGRPLPHGAPGPEDRLDDARGGRHPEELGRGLQPDGRDLGAEPLGEGALRGVRRHEAGPRHAARVRPAAVPGGPARAPRERALHVPVRLRVGRAQGARDPAPRLRVGVLGQRTTCSSSCA